MKIQNERSAMRSAIQLGMRVLVTLPTGCGSRWFVGFLMGEADIEGKEYDRIIAELARRDA